MMAIWFSNLRSALGAARYLPLILSISAVSPAAAEDIATYPSATIRIIVPYPAGGTADALPRIIGDRLQARWNQSVIIVNRPGAGGNIGAETVAVAEPNGYSLLASPPGPLVINEALYKELTFRPSDFEPAIVMGSVPNVMDVRPGFPSKSGRDVLNYILANPGKVTFASQGVGTTSHLAGILFEKLSNSSMVHVPYTGSAPALDRFALCARRRSVGRAVCPWFPSPTAAHEPANKCKAGLPNT
jgi:tripartite-type tricarboxylate transporter receptor subunit TctC